MARGGTGMTRKEAIEYLQPICDNAALPRYAQALGLALDALREVESLREKPRKETGPGMDRLTKRREDGVAWYNHQPEKSVSNDELLDRLAEYEDTGLMPKEIEELKKQVAGVVPVPFGTPVFVVEVCRCHAYGAEIEKREAECAERCTKAVAVIPLGHNRRCVNCAKLFERPFSEKYIGKVGKTVFLTREEAEKALEGGKADEKSR